MDSRAMSSKLIAESNEGHGRFSRYKLAGLIGEQDWILLDRSLVRVISLVRVSEGAVALIEQQRLAQQELALASILLESFPHWAPYEHLLEAHTGEPANKCRKVLQEAMDLGEFDSVIRPLRNVIHRCRMKLIPCGIDIRPILETGYILLRPDAGKGSRWYYQPEREPVHRR